MNYSTTWACFVTLYGDGRTSYLLSPLEGSPIASRGSIVTGLSLPHGPEGTLPPRVAIKSRCLRQCAGGILQEVVGQRTF